jgi:hypothetical protein
MTQTDSHICILCMKNLGDPETPMSATVFTGAPGYGSRHDSCLRADEELEILICDDCLIARKGQIVKVRTIRPPAPKKIRSSNW